MSDPQPNPYIAICPSRALLSVIGDKWSLLMFPLLSKGPMRNNELLREIDGISQKMLTQTLNKLTSYNLVNRRDFNEMPPRVEYSLTPLGHSLTKVIEPLDNWVIENFAKTNGQPLREG